MSDRPPEAAPDAERPGNARYRQQRALARAMIAAGLLLVLLAVGLAAFAL